MRERRITVAPLYRDNLYKKRCTSSTVTASLRLAGKWLQEAGFEAGQVVIVQAEQRKLTITPKA